MAVNTSGQFTADIENKIADQLLPLTRKQLVAYNFGDKMTLDKGRGTTYTASRYNRINLPRAPLAEGTPPVGQQMTLSQVTGTVQQWGDSIVLTDVAQLTIKHPLVETAKTLIALQQAELLDRNTFNALLSGTQVNYVNSRGSRGALGAGDVMNLFEITRITGTMITAGVPRFMGDEQTNMQMDAKQGQPKASSNPRANPHLVAILHPFVANDLRQNSTIVTAWSYSDINKLYNAELGQLDGTRFCASNMVPSFTGLAALTGTAGTAGSLATGSYYITVTASDQLTGYETFIYQVSGAIAVTGPNGSISVTLPNTLPNVDYSIYIGTTTSPANLGLSASGPTSGTLQGQATQLAGGTTVVVTATGVAKVPPSAPATGITVYPTFFFGRGAYGQVMLDSMKIMLLLNADKSDRLNQTRSIGWKIFYGTMILNQQFFARVEAASAFTGTFG